MSDKRSLQELIIELRVARKKKSALKAARDHLEEANRHLMSAFDGPLCGVYDVPNQVDNLIQDTEKEINSYLEIIERLVHSIAEKGNDNE